MKKVLILAPKGVIDRIYTNKTNPIVKTDPLTKNIIEIYLGCTQASRFTGIKRTTLSGLVSNRRTSTVYKGYAWRYATTEETNQYLNTFERIDKKLPQKCEKCEKVKHRLKIDNDKKVCYDCLYNKENNKKRYGLILS